ncbi:MAG: hypothetical protein LBC20_18405 [Planctomycetaceae bacterium]|jgi:hypothetical protein|nr:hypothetical protein [Planctomycetaceae bacterium]
MKINFFNIAIVLFATLLSLFFATNKLNAEVPKSLDGMFIINEDAWNFFTSRTPEQMTLKDLHAFVDQYAETKITHLFLNPNAQKTRFQSQTRDALWHDTDSKERLPQNAKLLHERGLDPYKIWIERCREKKISPWISMRMNDIHYVDQIDHFYHSNFWRNNPSFWRIPNDKSGHWINRALNYVYPEVQEHQMSFVRELFERYDFDGLELDWMRSGWHFTPGKEKEESVILNRFMQNVRKIAREWEKKRGHTIYIAVRTPYDPDVATTHGMNALQWAREGSIDLVIPTPYFMTSDFDIPVERWREQLDAITSSSGHSANIAVAPGMERHMQAWPGGKQTPCDLATLYGFVASVRFRGARNIYLFNWMDNNNPVGKEKYRTLLEKGVDDDVVLQSVRRHPVCYHDIIPDVNNHVQLPQTPNPEAKFTVPIGLKPESGKLWLIVGLGNGEGVKETVCSATLNGTKTNVTTDADITPLSKDVARALCFDCPLTVAQNDVNTITVRLESGIAPRIVWVELKIEPNRK